MVQMATKPRKATRAMVNWGPLRWRGDRLVGVEDELIDYDQKCDEGAGEPGHLDAEDGEGVVAADGCEPEILVGKIDERWRGGGDDRRDAETDQKADGEHDDFDDEELTFGLPAVGGTGGAEMSGHYAGYAVRKISCLQESEKHKQCEDSLGHANLAAFARSHRG